VIGRFDRYWYPHGHLNPTNSSSWELVRRIGSTFEIGASHPASCLCSFQRIRSSSRVKGCNVLA